MATGSPQLDTEIPVQSEPAIDIDSEQSVNFKSVSISRHESVNRVRHVMDPEERKKRAKFLELETELMVWVKEQGAKRLTVNCFILLTEGRRLYEDRCAQKPAEEHELVLMLGRHLLFVNRARESAWPSLGQWPLLLVANRGSTGWMGWLCPDRSGRWPLGCPFELVELNWKEEMRQHDNSQH